MNLPTENLTEHTLSIFVVYSVHLHGKTCKKFLFTGAFTVAAWGAWAVSAVSEGAGQRVNQVLK